MQVFIAKKVNEIGYKNVVVQPNPKTVRKYRSLFPTVLQTVASRQQYTNTLHGLLRPIALRTTGFSCEMHD